jgi:hypothetical protein
MALNACGRAEHAGYFREADAALEASASLRLAVDGRSGPVTPAGRSVFLPWLRDYLERVPSAGEDPAELGASLDRLRRWLVATRIEVWTFAALAGVSAGVPGALGPGLDVCPLGTDDRRELERRFDGTRPGITPRAIADSLHWRAAIRFTATTSRHHRKYGNGGASIERALDALYVATDADVGCPLAWVSFGSPHERHVGDHMLHRTVHEFSGRAWHGHIEAGAILGEWARAFAVLPQLAAREPRVAAAVRMLRGAAQRARPDDRVVDSWKGLEALFAPDRGRVTRQLAHAIADWTAEGPERAAVRSRARSAYLARGELVHGGHSPADPAFCWEERALRSSLRMCVHRDSAPPRAGRS